MFVFANRVVCHCKVCGLSVCASQSVISMICHCEAVFAEAISTDFAMFLEIASTQKHGSRTDSTGAGNDRLRLDDLDLFSAEAVELIDQAVDLAVGGGKNGKRFVIASEAKQSLDALQCMLEIASLGKNSLAMTD